MSIEQETETRKQEQKTGIMKTTIKQIASGTLIVLLSFAINANAHGVKINASGHENNYEPALLVEDWMINEAALSFSPSDEMTTEQETELRVESWMTENLDLNYVSAIEIESDKVMLIENWMFEDYSADFSLDNLDVETALAVENWMTE